MNSLRPFDPLAHLALLFGLGLTFVGCHSLPADALQLAPESAGNRQLQTRRFDNITEAELLSASAGVVQDLGFTLDESESKLGVISASRRLTSRRPMNGCEVATSLAWAALIPAVGAPFTAYGLAAGVKEPQLVRLSLVTSAPAASSARAASVRVTAQRIVYVNERMTKIRSSEPLNDPAFHQEFFARLSKSAFLQKQENAL